MASLHEDSTPVVTGKCRYCGEGSTYTDGPMPDRPPAFCRNGADRWMWCATQRIGNVRWTYAYDLFDDS